jgi:hypothetical protein
MRLQAYRVVIDDFPLLTYNAKTFSTGTMFANAGNDSVHGCCSPIGPHLDFHKMNAIPSIFSGGVGSRLWPVSRELQKIEGL